MKRIRQRLTYANVMSTIAVFLVIGGGAAVAANQLAKNSVGSKQLKKNAVTTVKIKNGAVTGPKIALSSLGTVPSAGHADSATNATNAQSLGGLSVAQIEAAAKPQCPSGTKPAAGVCFEETVRAVEELRDAAQKCAAGNRRLPSMGELFAFDMQYFTGPHPYEWVDSEYTEAGTVKGMEFQAWSPAGENIAWIAAVTKNAYRCVVPAV